MISFLLINVVNVYIHVGDISTICVCIKFWKILSSVYLTLLMSVSLFSTISVFSQSESAILSERSSLSDSVALSDAELYGATYGANKDSLTWLSWSVSLQCSMV